MKNNHSLKKLLNILMEHYRSKVPQYDQILSFMLKQNLVTSADEVENDHIAFRSFKVPHLGINSLEKIFLHHGYKKQDSYQFKEKKLDANWYSPPNDNSPRIFISELKIDEFNQTSQDIIKKYTSPISSDPVDSLNLDNLEEVANYLHNPTWQKPETNDYEELKKESEYAAWVLAHGHQFNHFTFSVHSLPQGYNTLEEFNTFLEKSGFLLNDSGGKIKISGDKKLLQSSTIAHTAPFSFKDETKDIPGSFVEFAERKILNDFSSLPLEQIERKHRREGFEVANANKIFESTYTSQTKRS
jgi:hypothetical protein